MEQIITKVEQKLSRLWSDMDIEIGVGGISGKVQLEIWKLVTQKVYLETNIEVHVQINNNLRTDYDICS